MSTLLEQLQLDVKEAMKSRDTERVQSLRMFVNALQVEAKAKLRDLDEGEQVAVLQKQKKQRIEAAEAFADAGHKEREAKELDQAALLDHYLPEPLSDTELEAIVKEVIAEVGASSPKDMGLVMKSVQPKVKGRADGKIISQLVQKSLREL